MSPVSALCHVSAPSEIHVSALSCFGPFMFRPLPKILSRFGPLHVSAPFIYNKLHFAPRFRIFGRPELASQNGGNFCLKLQSWNLLKPFIILRSHGFAILAYFPKKEGRTSPQLWFEPWNYYAEDLGHSKKKKLLVDFFGSLKMWIKKITFLGR